MAATLTPLPIKKPHSATRFSIDDILHNNDKNDYCIAEKKCNHDIKSHHTINDDNNNDNSSLAAIEFRERLMKNMLSFDKLTDRKYSSFTEPPIINKGITKQNIIDDCNSKDDLRDDLLLKERQRFYEELALKLKIPPRITSGVHDSVHHQKPEPTGKPSLLEDYKTSSSSLETQHLTPPTTPLKYSYDALQYRNSNITTASTHLSTIAARGGSIDDMENIDSLGEYRSRNFPPSPHRSLSAAALPLPPFPISPSSESHHRRFMMRSGSVADIYSSGSMRYASSRHHREPATSHPYYYSPPSSSHRYRYDFRHHSDPYDLHLSKCSYDITTRQYSSSIKTPSSNFSGCSPTSSPLSPTLGNSPTRSSSSPNKSPSLSSRQCKGITDSGNHFHNFESFFPENL